MEQENELWWIVCKVKTRTWFLIEKYSRVVVDGQGLTKCLEGNVSADVDVANDSDADGGYGYDEGCDGDGGDESGDGADG